MLLPAMNDTILSNLCPSFPTIFTYVQGLWNDVIWTTATREAFRKDPKRWYSDFWRVYFEEGTVYQPNPAHDALASILNEFPSVRQITQNIDGLQAPSSQLIEVHGRIGLYKCCPDDDSDTDSDSDDDQDRAVHLGHRRKAKAAAKSPVCPYQFTSSLKKEELVNNRADGTPRCPYCRNVAMPQALLFDEGYHSHSFYQFEHAEDWLSAAQVLVFCGTSFSVSLTDEALTFAREAQIPVFNLNLQDTLDSTAYLDASNVLGPATETLPLLLQLCRSIRDAK